MLVFVHMRAALGAYAVCSGAAAAAAAGAGVLPGMLAGADLFSRSLSLLNFCSSWRGRMGGAIYGLYIGYIQAIYRLHKGYI